MSDSRDHFERWWGSGVVWQLFLVACGAVGVYYSRIQALNSETPGREAIAKLQGEAKSNFEKLQETLRLIDERMVKLEKSEQAARQEAAIASLQTKLAALESKYKAPEEARHLRSALDDLALLRESRGSAVGNHSGPARIVPPSEWSHSTSSLLNKSNFLEPQDKTSIEKMLDAYSRADQPILGLPESPKFKFSPPPTPPKPQNFGEQVVSIAKTYGFLIFIMLVAIFSRK